MKKLLFTLMIATMVLTMCACGTKDDVISESVTEMPTEEQEQESKEVEVTEAPDNGEPSETTISDSTEIIQEQETEEAVDPEYLKGVSVHTMWIQEMTAKEAAITSIWDDENKESLRFDEDTPATVVGLLIQTEEGGDHVSNWNSVEWYTKENEEYIRIKESTSANTSPICGDEFAVVIGRFPTDKVDVNNLYLQIAEKSGTNKRYYQVQPDNLFDIYSLEANEVVEAEIGEIVYFQDIPFFITATPWQCRAAGFESTSNYWPDIDWGEYGLSSTDRTITLLPLTGQLSYDFSFLNSAKLSEDFISEDYLVRYTTQWDVEYMMGTIEGNKVNLCFDAGYLYRHDADDIYETENPDGDYWDDILAPAIDSCGMWNVYLELENSNRPATKLYFLK